MQKQKLSKKERRKAQKWQKMAPIVKTYIDADRKIGDAMKLYSSLQSAWKSRKILDLFDNKYVEPDAGYPIGGDIKVHSGFAFYVFDNCSSIVSKIFKQSEAVGLLPKSDGLIDFQNQFPINERTMSPVAYIHDMKDLGGLVCLHTVIVKVDGKYKMLNIFYNPDQVNRLPKVIEFLVNNLLLNATIS